MQRKVKINVTVANLDANSQFKIEPEFPLITVDGVEGYDLHALIEIAMEVYELSPQFVTVEYWDQ